MNDMESNLRRQHSVLIVLWALIFAKCFLLEYCVLVYAVPINSILYVWSLSLFMATVASLVYWKLTLEEQGGVNLSSNTGRIWSVCIALILLSALSALAWDIVAVHKLPAIVAGILCCGYLGQYFNRRALAPLYSSAGWLLAAGLLFGEAPPRSLLYFSLSLILFSALPSLIVYFKLRGRARSIAEVSA